MPSNEPLRTMMGPTAPGQNEATPIILCADDYGIAPGVGRAIRHLLALGRLSAASCMSISPAWPGEAQALKPLAGGADIGLHLTLTDQRPLGAMQHLAPAGRLPSIRRMIALAYAGRLERREIATEIRRQLDRFEAEFGRPPAFLDGHQHVHQLPIVREAVLALYQERLARHGSYLRYCDEPLAAIGRRRIFRGEALAISLLARGFARKARAAGIPGNRGFSGVHDFAGRTPYRRLFPRFLEGAKPWALVMAHPGISDAALAAADRVTHEREEEYRYFQSEAFPADLAEAGVRLAAFATDAAASARRRQVLAANA